MFAGMQELGDYVPVNVTPPHPMCGHCLPDISSHRGCYPHTISQYHWWYIVWYIKDYTIHNTQYHNMYNDISIFHHIMVYTTISTFLPHTWTISHFTDTWMFSVLPHTTKEGLIYISYIVYISYLMRYLTHSMQWRLFCHFGQNLLVDRTNDIICLMWALTTGAIVLIRRPPPRKCFSIKNDKSPVSLGAIKC